MLVRDAMIEQIETIEPGITVLEAARKMRDGDFGAIPVMNRGEVIGMITDRDLTVRVLAEEKDPEDVTVEEIMTKNVLSCEANDDLEIAAQMMADHQVRRLIVMEEGKIVGLISLGDIALLHQEAAAEAMGGISEHRHDEPGQEMNGH